MENLDMRELIERRFTICDTRKDVGGLEHEGQSGGSRSLNDSKTGRVNGQSENRDFAGDIGRMVDEWIRAQREVLAAIIAGILGRAAVRGLRDAFEYWNEQFGTNHTPPAPLVERARALAKKLTSTVLKKLREFVLDAVRKAIQKWKDEGLTESEILDKVRALLGSNEFGERHARELAEQNMDEAQHAGARLGHRTIGARAKEWITMRDKRVDAICRRNEAVGLAARGESRIFLHFEY